MFGLYQSSGAGIFHLLHEKFASRVENCSEIVKRACYFNRYLRGEFDWYIRNSNNFFAIVITTNFWTAHSWEQPKKME